MLFSSSLAFSQRKKGWRVRGAIGLDGGAVGLDGTMLGGGATRDFRMWSGNGV